MQPRWPKGNSSALICVVNRKEQHASQKNTANTNVPENDDDVQTMSCFKTIGQNGLESVDFLGLSGIQTKKCHYLLITLSINLLIYLLVAIRISRKTSLLIYFLIASCKRCHQLLSFSIKLVLTVVIWLLTIG